MKSKYSYPFILADLYQKLNRVINDTNNFGFFSSVFLVNLELNNSDYEFYDSRIKFISESDSVEIYYKISQMEKYMENRNEFNNVKFLFPLVFENLSINFLKGINSKRKNEEKDNNNNNNNITPEIFSQKKNLSFSCLLNINSKENYDNDNDKEIKKQIFSNCDDVKENNNFCKFDYLENNFSGCNNNNNNFNEESNNNFKEFHYKSPDNKIRNLKTLQFNTIKKLGNSFIKTCNKEISNFVKEEQIQKNVNFLMDEKTMTESKRLFDIRRNSNICRGSLQNSVNKFISKKKNKEEKNIKKIDINRNDNFFSDNNTDNFISNSNNNNYFDEFNEYDNFRNDYWNENYNYEMDYLISSNSNYLSNDIHKGINNSYSVNNFKGLNSYSDNDNEDKEKNNFLSENKNNDSDIYLPNKNINNFDNSSNSNKLNEHSQNFFKFKSYNNNKNSQKFLMNQMSQNLITQNNNNNNNKNPCNNLKEKLNKKSINHKLYYHDFELKSKRFKEIIKNLPSKIFKDIQYIELKFNYEKEKEKINLITNSNTNTNTEEEDFLYCIDYLICEFFSFWIHHFKNLKRDQEEKREYELLEIYEAENKTENFIKPLLKPFNKEDILYQNECETDFGDKRMTKKERRERECYVENAIKKGNFELYESVESDFIRGKFDNKPKKVTFVIPNDRSIILTKLN